MLCEKKKGKWGRSKHPKGFYKSVLEWVRETTDFVAYTTKEWDDEKIVAREPQILWKVQV